MKEHMIINCVPVQKNAPVAGKVLEAAMPNILAAIYKEQAVEPIFLVAQSDQTSKALIENVAREKSDLNMKVIAVDDSIHYVYTNESAVLRVIEGDNPVPRNKDKNLILYNVEDFMVEGNKQVFITGKVQQPSMHSFSQTIIPKTILEACQVEGDFKGMYFGYPMGMFVSKDQLDMTLELTTDEIRIFNEKDCMLAALKEIADEFQTESCGRCVFGYEGVTQINMILADVINKKGTPADLNRIKSLVKQMKDHTVCEIDAVLASAVETAFEGFEAEITEHITKKTCQAMACGKFVTYHILASKCVGCTECIDSCEDEAILGKKKFVHVIDQDECTQCGACVESCDEEAIVMAGAVKPKCPPKPIPCRR